MGSTVLSSEQYDLAEPSLRLASRGGVQTAAVLSIQGERFGVSRRQLVCQSGVDLLPEPTDSSLGRPTSITESGEAVCKRELRRYTKPEKSWFKSADTPARIGPHPGSHHVFRSVSFTSDLLCSRTVYHFEQAIPVTRKGAERVEFARLTPSRFTTRWRPNRHQFTIT